MKRTRYKAKGEGQMKTDEFNFEEDFTFFDKVTHSRNERSSLLVSRVKRGYKEGREGISFRLTRLLWARAGWKFGDYIKVGINKEGTRGVLQRVSTEETGGVKFRPVNPASDSGMLGISADNARVEMFFKFDAKSYEPLVTIHEDIQSITFAIPDADGTERGL